MPRSFLTRSVSEGRVPLNVSGQLLTNSDKSVHAKLLLVFGQVENLSYGGGVITARATDYQT